MKFPYVTNFNCYLKEIIINPGGSFNMNSFEKKVSNKFMIAKDVSFLKTTLITNGLLYNVVFFLDDLYIWKKIFWKIGFKILFELYVLKFCILERENVHPRKLSRFNLNVFENFFSTHDITWFCESVKIWSREFFGTGRSWLKSEWNGFSPETSEKWHYLRWKRQTNLMQKCYQSTYKYHKSIMEPATQVKSSDTNFV